jgi:hypothetical protein
MNDLLTVNGAELVSASATQAAFDKRDELALTCGTVKVVANAAQAEHAAATLREVKGFTRLIEDSRKVVKEPVLTLTKKIDGLAKELTEHLETEAARVSRLLGAYQLEQARIAREAQEKAYQEEQRLIREAAAKRDEIELSSRSAAVSERRIDKLEAKTFDAIATVRAGAATIAAAKPVGISTRNVVKFEVTDVHALYAARPELVKLEPNAGVINAVLRGSPKASIPGLRVWEEAAAIVR